MENEVILDVVVEFKEMQHRFQDNIKNVLKNVSMYQKMKGIFNFWGVFDVVFATKICKDYSKDAAKTAQRWPK